MEKQERQNIVGQSVMLYFAIMVIVLVIGVLLDFMQNEDYDWNLQSLINIFGNNYLIWILILLIAIIPVITYFTVRSHIDQIVKLKSTISLEFKKLTKVEDFIENLIKNNFKTTISDTFKKDVTFQKLEQLRDKMKNNKRIVDKQRREDERRNWHAEGLAKFGEILRDNSNDMEALGYNVVKNLIEYLDAIQGGFYILEEDAGDKYFDLVAFYAYGRKKYADKHIEYGKGLLGTCAMERETIYLKKIPDSYVTVTSGLGQANPKNLLLCPLITETELFGVLELASMNEFSEIQIGFVEKVSESIASTISTVRMNMRTSELLKETSDQAQALLAQEEEMRQNMEELQATQEEAGRQAQRFMRLETTVNHTMIRAEYNLDGTLSYANTKFLRKMEYSSNSQVEGKPIRSFIAEKDKEWFNRIWEGLIKGGRHFEGYMKHITRTGKDLWTIATYTCMRDDDGEVTCILFLAIDSTAQKEISLNMEGVVDAVNRSSVRIEFDTSGNIKDFNDAFLYLFKYSEKDTQNLNINDIIHHLELEDFNKKWENIVNGMNFQGQFKVQTSSGEEKWIRGAFSAVFDMYSEVQKVIYIGQDITNEKLMEIEFKQQNETLRKQEKMLRESEKDLSRKLKEARIEMQNQFKEIEQIKIRNERTLEGALDTIITTSSKNEIIFYNQAAEKLLGYTKEEVIGKNISMLFTEEIIKDDEFVQKYTSEGTDKIVGVRKEISLSSKSGEELPVLILLSEAEVDNDYTYTAFIQTIEVELF